MVIVNPGLTASDQKEGRTPSSSTDPNLESLSGIATVFLYAFKWLMLYPPPRPEQALLSSVLHGWKPGLQNPSPFFLKACGQGVEKLGL